VIFAEVAVAPQRLGLAQARVRIAQHGIVGEVKRFGAELDPPAFGKALTPWHWCAPIIETDASLFEAHELLAGLHSRKKELPEVAREYEAAPALKPDMGGVHLHLGMVLAAEGDRTGAAGHLRTAAGSGEAGVAAEATQRLRELGIR